METNSRTLENQDPNKVFESYGTFVKNLNSKVICKANDESLIDWTTTPLQASIITQLVAIGLVQSQVTQVTILFGSYIIRMFIWAMSLNGTDNVTPRQYTK